MKKFTSFFKLVPFFALVILASSTESLFAAHGLTSIEDSCQGPSHYWQIFEPKHFAQKVDRQQKEVNQLTARLAKASNLRTRATIEEKLEAAQVILKLEKCNLKKANEAQPNKKAQAKVLPTPAA